MEVGVLKVSHFLDAHVGEEGDVRSHLPALVHAENRQHCKGLEGEAIHPQERGQADQAHADAKGQELPDSPEGHGHIDGLECLGLACLRLPHLVLIDDARDHLVEVDGARVRRQQRGVESGRVRRREHAALGADVEHAEQAHSKKDAEEHDAGVVHHLPRPEEEDVLSRCQRLRGHEHRRDHEAAGEHLHALAHCKEGHCVRHNSEDHDVVRDGGPDLWVVRARDESHSELRNEVEERVQQPDEHGHREGLGDVGHGDQGEHIDAHGKEGEPHGHVGSEAYVGQHVLTNPHHLLHREVLQVPWDRL
mmetsp:Transcript_44636/g.115476  ORF Transcript_44636/g.115476 Transcript_44636/m.115476 type:complete len:306 (+) Transcript_44636:1748-2665(+)